MGGAHSREEIDTSDDEEYESGSNDSSNESDDERYEDSKDYADEEERKSSGKKVKTPNSMEEVEAKLRELKLKYGGQQQSEVNVNPNLKNAVKLYVYIVGSTKQGKWMVAEKVTGYSFVRSSEEEEEDGDVSESEDGEGLCWVLRVGRKVRVRVSAEVQLKTSGEQKRVDFVAKGVWAMKFFTLEDYKEFVGKFNECLFENTYGVEATDANKVKVYGKDFMGWVKPEVADESMWENAEDKFEERLSLLTPVRGGNDLREEFEEAADADGIQSLALGALDNSFLVGDSGVQVVKNYAHGIQGKGVYVNFDNGNYKRGNCSLANGTPKKALLMRAETNMLLMSPMTEAKPHSKGLHQLDIETGRIVTEWRFEKDGTDITMRDITDDGKGAQLDPSGSTFLGLDDNRLCRWDMRDKKGIVQDLITSSAPVLNWTQGHQFSRGTNFQCFATTGDGSIVVGSLDGKIRLYSNGSMRQAKTAFPGLGSPITHVDVTFDGKWILGTTDTYLILICSMFADKDGHTKTGFAARMGNRIAAPRLLKLTPLDSHLAGVNNKFRGAQFSWVTENGKQERHLVATVGKFSVIWNFQNVKNGSHECYLIQEGLKSCYCYKIVLKDESIIDSRFMNDRHAVTDSPEAPLVVATSRKIRSFSISSKK